MLQYLAPHVFTSSEAFDEAFLLETKKSSANSTSARARTQIDRERLMQAHYLMRLFVLRRLKSEVEKKLPPKLETKINCPMTALQLACVRKLLLNEQSFLLRSSGNSSQDGLRNLKSLVAQLRKAANHPFLFEGWLIGYNMIFILVFFHILCSLLIIMYHLF
jgi:SWI/SNF-related matrix-associated actin-dependent regulator of chromatin subfamily A member 5